VHVIDVRRQDLSESNHNDPSFMQTLALLKMTLNDERQASIKAYEGLVRPSQYNKLDRHAWWDDRDYDEVMAHWRAGLPPPAKCAISTPMVAPKPMRSSQGWPPPASAPAFPLPRRHHGRD
jgi:hypothetical protein